jgi:hypothetical protein
MPLDQMDSALLCLVRPPRAVNRQVRLESDSEPVAHRLSRPQPCAPPTLALTLPGAIETTHRYGSDHYIRQIVMAWLEEHRFKCALHSARREVGPFRVREIPLTIVTRLLCFPPPRDSQRFRPWSTIGMASLGYRVEARHPAAAYDE